MILSVIDILRFDLMTPDDTAYNYTQYSLHITTHENPDHWFVYFVHIFE